MSAAWNTRAILPDTSAVPVRPVIRHVVTLALASALVVTPITVGKPGSGSKMPSGVSVSGLTAGSGSVDVREYIDLGTTASGQAHQRIVGELLSGVAAGGVASISLRPLATSTDVNSTEAGRAVVAAARQNKAWEVTSALIRAQAAGGDWVNPAVLGRIGRGIAGLKVAKFLRDAGPAAYPQLNVIRREATKAGVTITPAFVVRGPSGTRLLNTPSSASQIVDAIQAVR